jgi:fructose-1,6-bisphosphatase II
MPDQPSRNIGLDLVRVTESAAVAAGRWIGSGRRDVAHASAMTAMDRVLKTVNIDGHIVIGEEGRIAPGVQSPLDTDTPVGTGRGVAVDVVVDPIDGTGLLIRGHPGAISLIGMTPRGCMWTPYPGVYMEKIVVDSEAAQALVPECLDAPAAWTLALVARVKGKPVRDLTVKILHRVRHQHLVEEIRRAGARIVLSDEGDAEGALAAAIPDNEIDLLMGIGGTSEGVTAACAVKALNGGMLARLAPQSDEEREAVLAADLDPKRILTLDEIVTSNDVFFAATAITNTTVLDGVRYRNDMALTHSILLRAATHTRRFIRAEFPIEDEESHVARTLLEQRTAA